MVRTRFAPSPTGSLHVGNARIAVLNWLFTRRHGGAFVLRIEDTDRARTVAGAEERIERDLRWLGLDWDEGPSAEGSAATGHGPYRQTERLALYRAAAERVRGAGFTYECWCADDEETTAGADAETTAAVGSEGTADASQRSGPPVVRCPCAELTADAIARLGHDGRTPALRFRVPRDRTITVHDHVFGDVVFESTHIADFIVLRPDGVPTYNFAAVVDDAMMEITHVIRGAGHLSNTPRQLLLYEALGARPPAFAHVPMVLGPDRQKLSKRHGARAVAEYMEEGYHADAVVNYLSLLSWSSPSGEEVLARDRLVSEISLDRIGVADVVFDPQKLRWLSAQHIARMPLNALVAAVRPYVDPVLPIADAQLATAIAAVRTHLSTLSEVNEHLAAFFPSAQAAGPAHDTGHVLEAAYERIAGADWQENALTAAVRAAGKDAGVGGAALYEPLRLALTGRAHGPPLAAVLLVQGRPRALEALQQGMASIRDHGGDGK